MHKLYDTARRVRSISASLFISIASDGTTSANQIIMRAVAMRINAPSLTIQDTHEDAVPSHAMKLRKFAKDIRELGARTEAPLFMHEPCWKRNPSDPSYSN